MCPSFSCKYNWIQLWKPMTVRPPLVSPTNTCSNPEESGLKEKRRTPFSFMLSWLWLSVSCRASYALKHWSEFQSYIWMFFQFPPTCWILPLHRAQTRSCTAAPWILCHLQERDASPPGTYGLSGTVKTNWSSFCQVQYCHFFFFHSSKGVKQQRGAFFNLHSKMK